MIEVLFHWLFKDVKTRKFLHNEKLHLKIKRLFKIASEKHNLKKVK